MKNAIWNTTLCGLTFCKTKKKKVNLALNTPSTIGKCFKMPIFGTQKRPPFNALVFLQKFH